jgi:hypothetical protein
VKLPGKPPAKRQAALPGSGKPYKYPNPLRIPVITNKLSILRILVHTTI